MFNMLRKHSELRILTIRILHTKKLPFNNEGAIQIFLVKLKIKSVYHTRHSLREILKNVL